jgi:putative Ig domain-containing protein
VATNLRSTIWLIAILVSVWSLAAAQVSPLVVVDQSLPKIEAGLEFDVFLRASGGVPPYIWSVAGGELPEGITLNSDGLLAGRPTKPGAFALTLKVEDSGHPARTINKEIKFEIATSLLLEWLQPPKVRDNRIDGSVQVSNGSTDTFDLTVIIVAVAENGRATAIGYQHFPLKPGSNNIPIPFSNTMPFGAYVIHADAIAEIPNKHAILRQRLQTPQPLQVTQGP